MRKLNTLLKNRKIDYKKLIDYGFVKDNNIYTFQKKILNDDFKIIITIDNNYIFSKVIELPSDEEYYMVDVASATGEFVGKVKNEYDNAINSFFKACTNVEIFKSNQSKQIIEYIKEKYGDNLEYLWSKFPNNAIWRNDKNNKWYGLLLTIPKSKIDGNSDDILEIIDLRYQKELINDIVDYKNIYPGYHMNKKSWITIILDGDVKIENIFKLIDNSYEISNASKN